MVKPGSRREWEAKIIAHAWKDSDFRKRLLANPKSALKEIHCPISEKLQLKVIEEDENQWVLILPKAPVEAEKLSEAELCSFAGGNATAGTCGHHACTDYPCHPFEPVGH